MIVSVRVTTNSKKPLVIPIGENRFKIKVDAPAVEGKANDRLIEILSDYFKKRKSDIVIIKGIHSKEKLIQII